MKNIKERLIYVSQSDLDTVLHTFNSTYEGLTYKQVEESLDKYGKNIVTTDRHNTLLKKLYGAFINPFTLVLIILAIVSAFTDIIYAPVGEKNPITVIIITVMVLISGFLRFIQEARSERASEKLNEMIETTSCIKRYNESKKEIPVDEIVVGDIVYLSAGDLIPADIRLLNTKDLFINQSALTGESEPVEKTTDALIVSKPIESTNLAFMGSTVVSGSGKAIVIAVGDDTLLGETAQTLNADPTPTTFEKGVNSVSWVLIRFMLVMVPIVLFINGFTKGNWLEAVLFAISVAVGLTPEMLPMIVTTCLARGAVNMSKKKVIIKKLNSIQNLGSIDILCTDKTGTLTQNKVVLEKHLDLMGNEDERVLRHAFLNSHYQTGLKNLMDIAIIEKTEYLQEHSDKLRGLDEIYTKIDEIPFEFERRRMSVVVQDHNGKTEMITKGAVEEMLSISAFVDYNNQVIPLSDEMRSIVTEKVNKLNNEGMRVLGVAHKTNPRPVGQFSVQDEKDMVLIGYLAFLDPPKETTQSAIQALHENGVDVKVLTGDNEKVTSSICRQIGLPMNDIILGTDLDDMSDEELRRRAENTTIFAKLSPAEKARVVTALRDNGHTVGYMGDGINDAPAMKVSDVGISVDSAVDIAKESADVILLEKDLTVLRDGIIEGRKTYANMIKYIKMTASSNFGNMFSVLAASAFLPFLPMESIHLILLNLIYDISCITIPWDNVDEEFLKEPRKWDASSIGKFMLWIGPTSSIFDIVTYSLMYFTICPRICGGPYKTLDPATQMVFMALFQTGWFVESMWSQTLVIHMIRTPKIPFVQSKASIPVTSLTFMGSIVLTLIPFTPLGRDIGLTSLPTIYFFYLVLIVLAYMCLVTIVKNIYIKHNGELL
ncbi:magnesium-translocating P-type ATPase [uncultured Catenibacterium sp.]|uniref:magnesium-translocating P-type ATPase n=1 Tax=uncultured Catenibacterium sp. TaxID=286142 RepID=UPI0025FAA4CC|nr:magnesium-translocating P-type ATPase [uncultured Catenibacterium sp.]